MSCVTSLGAALEFSGVKLKQLSPDHCWHLSAEFMAREHVRRYPWLSIYLKHDIKYKSNWALESVLQDIINSDYWHSHSAEALRRTPVDLVLFGCLFRRKEKGIDFGAWNLVLKAEYPIVTECIRGQQKVAGLADYVFGYCYSPDEASSELKSIFVVVEVKKSSTISQGMAQVVLYMAGIQQKKANKAMTVVTVYGVLTDGVRFEFLSLDQSKNLRASRQYNFAYDDEVM